jgi:hypothetical protein
MVRNKYFCNQSEEVITHFCEIHEQDRKKKFSFVSDQGNVKTSQNLSNATPITKDEDHPEVYFKISLFHVLVRFSFFWKIIL